MSGTVRDPLDMEAVLAQLARARQETEKFVVEQHKLNAEAIKLLSESRKFDRERWIVPLTAVLTTFGLVLAAIIARLPEILRAMGVGP